MFEKTTVTEFINQLAAKAPVPGGGGASALAGAIGIALGDMVGELTAGKKKYADAEEDIRALMKRADELQANLLSCMEKDATAFEPLSRAYRIPKTDPNREEIMESCLREAALAPLEIFDLCCEAMELLREFVAKGSPLVISDAATGAVLVKGAMYGAAVNVKVNTKLMKNRPYAGSIDGHIDEKIGRYGRMADEIYDSVYQTF